MGTAGAWTTLFHRGLRAACTAALGCLVAGQSAHAAGTTAGTLIGNTASLQFQIGGGPLATTNASSPDIVVGKVVSVVVTSQDAAPVGATSPDSSRPLAFTVTNTGNAPEAYRLARADNLSGDQFDPVPGAAGALWIESGAQPGFQASGPNADIAYVAGANDPMVAPDASVRVYLVSDIPAGAANGATGKSSLTATATTPGAAAAAPGTALGTFGGVLSVAGTQTVGTASGSYLVAAVSVTLAKSIVAARDPQGGTRVVAGSVLTYRLVLSVTGTGIADAVAVSDPLPPALGYVAGSLTVDGAPRTDAADADGASAAGNTVTADFGSLAAPAQRVIEFKATVH